MGNGNAPGRNGHRIIAEEGQTWSCKAASVAFNKNIFGKLTRKVQWRKLRWDWMELDKHMSQGLWSLRQSCSRKMRDIVLLHRQLPWNGSVKLIRLSESKSVTSAYADENREIKTFKSMIAVTAFQLLTVAQRVFLEEFFGNGQIIKY